MYGDVEFGTDFKDFTWREVANPFLIDPNISMLCHG
jgi:hypothetical protein